MMICHDSPSTGHVAAKDAWGQGILVLHRLRNLSARAVADENAENAQQLLEIQLQLQGASRACSPCICEGACVHQWCLSMVENRQWLIMVNHYPG